MQELLSDQEFLETIIPTTISLIVTGIISLFIGVFLERYRNKIVLVDYRIFNNRVANALKDDFWGNIKVQYNNTEVKNLTFTTIEIRNNTNNDISDFSIRFRSNPHSIIVAQNGYTYENNETLLLDNDYYQLFQDTIQKNIEYEKEISDGSINQKPKDHSNLVDYVTQNKIFEVPVFNRKTTLYFDFLLTNFSGEELSIEPLVNKKGLKLVKRESVERESKKLLNISTVIGLIIYTLLVGTLCFYNKDSIFLIIALYLFSLVYVFLGMFIFKTYRYLKNILL